MDITVNNVNVYFDAKLNLDGSLPRDDFLRMLIEPLAEKGIVTDKTAFLQAVIEREDELPTQTPEGVAIPHACSEAVNRMSIVMATVKEPGIVFDEFEDNNCQVAFLIAIPGNAPGSHLPILSKIATILMNGNLKAIANVQTLDDAANLLK